MPEPFSFEYNNTVYTKEVANAGEAQDFIDSVVNNPYTVGVAGDEPIRIQPYIGGVAPETASERYRIEQMPIPVKRTLLESALDPSGRLTKTLMDMGVDYGTISGIGGVADQAAFDVAALGSTAAASMPDIALGTVGAFTYPFETLIQGTPTNETLLGIASTFPTATAVEELFQEVAPDVGAGVAPRSVFRRVAEPAVPFGPPGGRLRESLEGLASGVGGETLGALEKAIFAKESDLGRLLGMLGAPVTTRAAEDIAKGTIPVAEQAVQALRPDIEGMAAEELQKFVPAVFEPEFQQAQTIGAAGTPRTLAEVEPSAAMYQKVIEQSAPEIAEQMQAKGQTLQEALTDYGATKVKETELPSVLKETAQTMEETKQAAQGNLIEIVADPTTLQPMEQGGKIRENLQLRRDQDNDLLNEEWERITRGPEGRVKVNVSAGKDVISEFVVGKTYAKQYANLPEELKTYIETLQNTPDSIRLKDLDKLRKEGTKLFPKISGDRQALFVYMNIQNAFLDAASDYATKKKMPEVKVLKDLITAQKDFYDTYGTGVVRDILKPKYTGFEKLAMDAEDIVGKLIAKPSKVQELINKFGRGFKEKMVLRQALLNKMHNQTPKNYSKFIDERREIFQKVFGGDLELVESYAQRAVQPTGYEKYAKLANATIPQEIFKNDKATQEFVDFFADTPAIELAQGRFIELMQKPSAKKGTYEDLKRLYGSQGKILFGNEYDDVIEILDEVNILKGVERAERGVARANSITGPTVIKKERIELNRDLIQLARKGTVLGSLIGTLLPSGERNIFKKAGGLLIGARTGRYLEKLGKNTEEQLNTLLGELLRNPEQIKLLQAPANKENVKQFESILMQLSKGELLAKSSMITGRQLEATGE